MNHATDRLSALVEWLDTLPRLDGVGAGPLADELRPVVEMLAADVDRPEEITR